MPAKSGGGRPPMYKLADGRRVPSVTTITKRFAEAGGLIRWANQIGLEGKSMDDERDSAASAGKIVHQWIEDDLLGCDRSPPPSWATPDDIERAEVAYGAYFNWKRQVRLEVLETEMPRVSERHRFGGTFDALVRLEGAGGALATLDWKSSGRVYADMIIQQAGYALLIEETSDLRLDGFALLRIGKVHCDFHYHHYPRSVVDVATKAFLGMRELYETDKELGKLL